MAEQKTLVIVGNRHDVVVVDERKATINIDANGEKYLSNGKHSCETGDNKLYTRDMLTQKFKSIQSQIYTKLNVLVLDVDEVIAVLCKHANIVLVDPAKADTTTQDKISAAIAYYFKQGLTQDAIIAKMIANKIDTATIQKHFPSLKENTLAF